MYAEDCPLECMLTSVLIVGVRDCSGIFSASIFFLGPRNMTQITTRMETTRVAPIRSVQLGTLFR